MLVDLNFGSGSASPISFVNYNNKMYFLASDGINNRELWEYNDSTFTMLTNLDMISSGWYNSDIVASNSNGVYFVHSDSINGHELWKYNEDTLLTYNLSPGNLNSFFSSFHILNQELIFLAFTPSYGYELWKADSAGVSLIQDVAPLSSDFFCSSFKVYNNELFFAGNLSASNDDLWKYDGDTITKVFDASTIGPDFNVSNLGIYQGQLIFNIDDYITTNTIMTYDGNNFNSLFNLSSQFNFNYYVDDDLIYFQYDSLNGNEIWVYNSINFTEVADINAGTSNSNPKDYFFYQNEIYFIATDDQNGKELWKIPECSSIQIVQQGPTLGVVPVEGVQFQWFDCTNSSLILGEIGATYTPPVNGYFAVIIDGSICYDTTICYEVFDVDILDFSVKESIIYPNPTNDLINFDLLMRKLNKLYVYNNQGEIMKSYSFSERNYPISIAELPASIYILHLLFTDGSIQITKIIKTE